MIALGDICDIAIGDKRTVGMARNRENVQFLVRLPDEIHGKIRDAAEENCRSMNGEILYQLRRIYTNDNQHEKADATA